jgi:hypothetical protein
VKVEGVGYGLVDLTSGPLPDEVDVTWARRNRLTEAAPLAWTDADQEPEAGQTTTIVVMDGDRNVLETHDAIAGTSFAIPIASFEDDEESVVASGIIRVTSKRDGTESWSGWELPFLLVTLTISGSPPTSAAVGVPYEFVVTLVGGEPPYVCTLVGDWPSWADIEEVNETTWRVFGTPDAADEFTDLSVRVTDDNEDTADLAPFNLSVVVPGDQFVDKLAVAAAYFNTDAAAARVDKETIDKLATSAAYLNPDAAAERIDHHTADKLHVLAVYLFEEE